jgi:hypothetical protein
MIAGLVLLAALSACSGAAEPRIIASYPQRQPAALPTPYAPPPGRYTVVYNAYLEMEVADVDAAAGRAVQLAYELGGYLTGSQTARYDGGQSATLSLAVPSSRYEDLHRALLGLGSLASETVSGDLTGPSYIYPEPFSQITVHLRSPQLRRLPSIVTGWRPLATLRNAMRVSASIFGFLADILIWVLVVAGPFVLLAWAAWRIFKRRRV